jgi:hypothetical protein
MLANVGQAEEGIERIREGLASIQATGGRVKQTHRLAMLVNGCNKAGKAEEGLNVLPEALALVRGNCSGCRAIKPHLKPACARASGWRGSAVPSRGNCGPR